MKRIKPIWLKNCKLPKDSFGNKAAENSGKYIPTNDGPKTIPAIISPITDGCPIFLKTHPNKRATKIIVTICANNIANGCCRFSTIECKKSFQWLLSIFFLTILRPTSSAAPFEITQYISAVKPPIIVT